MAAPVSSSGSAAGDQLDAPELRLFVMGLFFIFGGITSLNDVIIPKLKELFTLNYTQAMLVQFCFFTAYAVIGLPGAALVKKIGYMRGAVAGLLTMMLGCLLFVPASQSATYPLFLAALFVLASGVVVVQVVTNPLISLLGPARTAHSRLTFAQAAAVCETLLRTEYDAVRLVFNRFCSAISYKATVATVLSPDALEKAVEAGGALDAYEVEGPDRAELLQDLAEFHLAATLFNAMLENNCSEQAARMAAMESSTKNATEILGKLTLTYNRSRQASITTELIEIISGAAALEG